MKSNIGNHFPIIDISKANFTKRDLEIFNNEVKKTVEYGLFPFAAFAKNNISSSFKISKINSIKEIFSFFITCEKQGEYGGPNEFDIRKDDILAFFFYEDCNQKLFTHFSTNLSSQLFSILLASCPVTSAKLHLELINSDYAIANNSDGLKPVYDYLKSRKPDKNLSTKLSLYILNNLANLIFTRPDSTRNSDDVINAIIKRMEIQINSADELEKFKADYQNPLSQKRCEYVAKYEIIQQLEQSKILNDLPTRPVIIDVGNGDGLNTLALQKHLPNSIVLGIEPRKIQAYDANKNGVLTYSGFVEDIPELEGTADLVTVFNANPRSNADNFYRALAKLLTGNGKLILGIDVSDSPITSNGKTAKQNLDKYFFEVKIIPNPQHYTQTIYLASMTKIVENLKEFDSKMIFFKDFLQKFVDNQKIEGKIRFGEDYSRIILKRFLHNNIS